MRTFVLVGCVCFPLGKTLEASFLLVAFFVSPFAWDGWDDWDDSVVDGVTSRERVLRLDAGDDFESLLT